MGQGIDGYRYISPEPGDWRYGMLEPNPAQEAKIVGGVLLSLIVAVGSVMVTKAHAMPSKPPGMQDQVKATKAAPDIK